MKIRNHLFYLSGGLYGQLGNVFAVKHSEGYFMIDAGNPGAYDVICENLHNWGIFEDEITHVFLTHGHDDHAGTVSKFQELGAKIVVGDGDQYMLEAGSFGVKSPFKNHQMPCCTPDLIIAEDTHMNVGGVDIDIYTVPGHTKGHLLFAVKLEEDLILFSGDMFYCDGERGDLAYTGWKGDMDYDSRKLGESFAKLWDLDLSPTIVVGGHGNPRIGSGAKDMIMLAYKYYLINNR